MPKTREQNELIKQERYDHIIDTCISLFATRGYGSVTVDQITETANCSHGLFYHYFKNKDEAFYAMMEIIINDIAKLLEPIDFEHQLAKYSIVDFVNLIIKKLLSNDDRFACIIYLLLNLKFKSALPKPPRKNETLELKKQPLYNIAYFIINKGQVEGDFYKGDTKEYCIALLSMIKGLAYNRLAIGSKKFITPSTDVIIRLVMKGE